MLGFGEYLNDTKTKHRRRHVRNPHTRKHRHPHIRQQYRPRLRASFTQHKRRHHLRDVVLGECGSDSEAAEEEHDDGRPHGGENVGGCLFGGQAGVGFDVLADDLEDDDEEGDEQGGYEEGDCLRKGD